jgi:nucleotide-binding universal stress UspA family protein
MDNDLIQTKVKVMVMKKILLATDGSEHSHRTAEYARHFLDAWPEAELVAVYVSNFVPTRMDGISYGGMIYNAEPISTIMDYEQGVADQIESDVERIFSSYRDRFKFVHVTGNPIQEICNLADRESVDFIVIGSHGASALDRILLGSVSHGVVQRANKPVFVVR